MRKRNEMSTFGAVASTVISFFMAGALLYGFQNIMGWDAASWNMISFLVVLVGLSVLIGAGISSIYDRLSY